MGVGANQFLVLYPETTWGVFPTSPTPIYPRLTDSNPFTLRPVPMRHDIRSMDGFNRRRQNISQRETCAGKLSTPLYPSQASALLGWATTLTSNNLGSMSIDHFDGVRVRRYLGAMVKDWTINMASATNEGIATLELGLLAQTRAEVDPATTAPAPTVYPPENPYNFFSSAGGVTLGATGAVVGVTLTSDGVGYTSAPTVTIAGTAGSGATAIAEIDEIQGIVTRVVILTSGSGYTAPTITFTGGGATTQAAGTVQLAQGIRTKYKTLSIKGDNKLASTWDELPYISSCYYSGRDIDLTLALQYLSIIDRNTLESQANLTASVNLAAGAHSCSFNFNSMNYVATVDDDLPIEQASYQTLHLESFYDQVAGSDLTLTVV